MWGIFSVENKINHIKTQVDEIKSDLTEIKVTMAVNTASLETHIKRTDLLQTMVEEFKDHMLLVNTTIKVVIAFGGFLLFLQQLGLLDKLFRF